MSTAKTKATVSEKPKASNDFAASKLTDLQKSIFTSDELVKMSNKFNTSPDIVKAALKVNRVTETSFYNAEKIIKNFRTKEVHK